MNQEAQIIASLLRYGVQFLSPIPDDKETELVTDLASDAHALFTEVVWSDDILRDLLRRWFQKGREYEQNTSALNSVPGSVDAALKNLIIHEIQTFFARFATDLEGLCRLLWLWFQRGRTYEAGNAT